MDKRSHFDKDKTQKRVFANGKITLIGFKIRSCLI
ncbi:hypothetical protein Q787_04255 [Ornithobacterium rhinotracheale H06-030791]|nr:hypothetical protein Q785_04380 [Ornithobacterium rhinotracheale ORT-UMN 88]KGB67347.1 hypothetical protein Q787_04255 [Ornithobacterium rhinotracheale H06-030791]